MPPVGPELPPHLAKRKRSIDDDAEGGNSPPHKVLAASVPARQALGPSLPPTTNPDELQINDSSDDDCGSSSLATRVAGHQIPSNTKAVGPQMPLPRVAGPTLPPSKNPDELNLDSSSDDDYGPSIPKSSIKPSSPPPKKRILGPAPPPAPLSEIPSHPTNDNDTSDSENDYGPSLPPTLGSVAEQQIYEREREQENIAAVEAQPAKPKRDEWMLAPPSDSDWTSRVDPTKLKNRKFASGKGAKAPAEKGQGISAIWTETPEEKRKRLEDEVLGRAEAATSLRSKQGKSKTESKEDIATARRIKEYNERNRGHSLMEQREKAGGKKEEEDDPSKRGFDREKDMALGGRMGHGQKREMLAKAADFGSRFQKGNYL
ncbi:hypothetical protein BGZ60DRAFT_467821 [Tricladium varicosporioides]|nr:hypothetical protein BGZ60DRAFT_467821 [Hymenoscyphus varicosporioides]